MDGVTFIENIPFNETRDYVKQVMLNYLHYEKVLNGKDLSLRKVIGDVPSIF